MHVIKLIQDNIYWLSDHQRRLKRVWGPNFFPYVAAASARHEELQGSDHPGPCSHEVCVLVHKSFPKRDKLTKCQHKDGLSISCLVPSFRTNPPGSESYCPACSVHTQGQESSRWAQGLAGDRAGGSDLTLRCWSWFSALSKADQLNCIDLSQELQRAWGAELPEPVRAPLILERSAPELLISISGSPERPLPKVARNQGYGDYLESIQAGCTLKYRWVG